MKAGYQSMSSETRFQGQLDNIIYWLWVHPLRSHEQVLAYLSQSGKGLDELHEEIRAISWSADEPPELKIYRSRLRREIDAANGISPQERSFGI